MEHLVLNPGESLGSNGLDELELNLLNPGQKTYFDLWRPCARNEGDKYTRNARSSLITNIPGLRSLPGLRPKV
ncbi:hypothetical protein GQ600_26279 [Phytophthora cactorum]|nr:hypothetical protein GQ600_26279 [Phytophthora cactorum]